MNIAAWTESGGGTYPPYLSVNLTAGVVEVFARGRVRVDEKTGHLMCGDTVSIVMTKERFVEVMENALREIKNDG